MLGDFCAMLRVSLIMSCCIACENVELTNRKAMNCLLSNGKHVVAIMGGHKLARGSKQYRDAAKISRNLTKLGMLVCSGGGPGAMEACNLGVWFANRTDQELEDAITLLAKAPFFQDKDWLSTAYQIRNQYPLIQSGNGGPEIISLGIPTFFYGHEPPNMFQTHCAKFFANSIREDALLSMAFNGIIYFVSLSLVSCKICKLTFLADNMNTVLSAWISWDGSRSISRWLPKPVRNNDCNQLIFRVTDVYSTKYSYEVFGFAR